MITARTTKYTTDVVAYVRQVGHASNAQILRHLQLDYPELSATTVHRITTRLVERGELATAPVGPDNAALFDANTAPHDHFQCQGCGRLQDVILPANIFAEIQSLIGDCRLNGRLVVQGSCENCKH